MKRTTIVAEESQLLEIEQIAKRQKRSTSGVIREALNEYIAKQKQPPRDFRFIGQAKSGRSDVSERAEELIERGLKK